MPALFSLAMRPALQEIQDRLPDGACVVAYLDDVYVICKPAETAEAYETVREVLQRVCHIDVNLGKLAAWSKNEAP
eukprot:2496574-Karenia_brevis.AAC.1